MKRMTVLAILALACGLGTFSDQAFARSRGRLLSGVARGSRSEGAAPPRSSTAASPRADQTRAAQANRSGRRGYLWSDEAARRARNLTPWIMLEDDWIISPSGWIVDEPSWYSWE